MVCCPSDQLQFSESQWNYYIWKVCSADSWGALKTAVTVTGIGQKKGPSFSLQHSATHHINKASKVEWIGLQSFALSIIFACVCAKSLQSCLTLCDPMDCSLPGSSVLGILQIRILKWVAIPSYRGSSQSRDQTQSPVLQAYSLPLSHRGSPYSPDLLPTGYHFFKHLDNFLQGKCFHS